MIVIIAEKPSLGRAVANALPDRFIRKEGYLQGETIIVTWAFGHLFGLKDIEDYEPSYQGMRWDEIPLPYYPHPFQFELKKDMKTKKVDSGVKKQFKIICDLINDPNTNEIICCGDADREGEVIVRLILEKGLKNKHKKITRLWLPEQTPKGIRDGFQARKEDSFYDNLYNEGLSRTYIDWLLGINLSRSLSVLSKAPLSVGRVVCPIVKAVYERDKETKNFVPQNYLQLETKQPFPMSSNLKFSVDEVSEAMEFLHSFNRSKAIVKDIFSKKETISAPKLFSLSKLQGYCGKKFKLTPKETLDIVQNLYEKGVVTYPRTNTEFLAENEKDKVKELLQIHGGEQTVFKDSKSIFDDSKIESHSALIPTYKQTSNLTEKEQAVYDTILHRFLAVFWAEPFTQNVSEAIVQVGDTARNEEIKIKGRAVLTKGWTDIEPVSTKESVLPNISKGDCFDVIFELVKKQTTPPKKYSASTLNEYLKHPFKKESEDIEEEYKQLFLGCEIGTEATRADIIDKAIKKQYISLRKNVYSILPKGIFLVETIKHLNLDMSAKKTVELQKTLKKVYHGELSVDDSVRIAQNFLDDYFNNIQNKKVDAFDCKQNDKIGNCPWCGEPLYKKKGRYGIYYSHQQSDNCGFTLNHTIKVYGQNVNLTDAQVKKLCDGKSIPLSLISRNGKPYKVKIYFSSQPKIFNNKQYPDYNIEFVNKK